MLPHHAASVHSGGYIGIMPTSRHDFAREISRPDDQVDLARAALLIAKEEYPQLSLETYLLRLDAMAEDSRDRLDGESAPLVVLQETISRLFGRTGLRGNRDRYYDPRNSFLNDVLDRGLGIPLTLSLVLLEVGWRLGLKVEGVNFPGHFLVRLRGDVVPLLVDPFHGGSIRFQDEAQSILQRQHGPGTVLRKRHLRTAGRRQIVVRLLLNLKGVYLRAGDHSRALAAVERILVVHPTAADQIRDRGYLLARMGRREAAVEQLETYLTFAPGAGDAGRVETLVRKMRRGGNPKAGSE